MSTLYASSPRKGLKYILPHGYCSHAPNAEIWQWICSGTPSLVILMHTEDRSLQSCGKPCLSSFGICEWEWVEGKFKNSSLPVQWWCTIDIAFLFFHHWIFSFFGPIPDTQAKLQLILMTKLSKDWIGFWEFDPDILSTFYIFLSLFLL